MEQKYSQVSVKAVNQYWYKVKEWKVNGITYKQELIRWL